MHIETGYGLWLCICYCHCVHMRIMSAALHMCIYTYTYAICNMQYICNNPGRADSPEERSYQKGQGRPAAAAGLAPSDSGPRAQAWHVRGPLGLSPGALCGRMRPHAAPCGPNEPPPPFQLLANWGAL
jgi:hypothetical protein